MTYSRNWWLCGLWSITCLAPIDAIDPQSVPAQVAVRFSPMGGCTDAIIAALGTAEKTISVQAYSFTSKPIATALRDAHRRGVVVQVILDKSQRHERYSGADFLVHAGIPVWIDERPAIAHSKVMIIDGRTVITGSFNFTKGAEEKNVENLLLIDSTELAERYQRNWDSRKAVSVVYDPMDKDSPHG